jgi:ketosteroid isomerase-like protein
MTANLTTTTEHPISLAEERLRQAMLDSDVEALDALISSELVFTNHLGQVFGKQDDIALHRSGVLKFHSLEPSEMQMKVDGPIAVVSVRMKLSGAYGGTPFAADLRYTRIWRIEESGAWKIVAGHSSAVQG